MIPWLLVTELLCTTGKTLGELVGQSVETFPSPGEINSKLADAKAAIARVKEAYAPNAVDVSELDGISIEYPNWRFNLRSSNTEPVVRLNLETRGDKALMEEKLLKCWHYYANNHLKITLNSRTIVRLFCI